MGIYVIFDHLIRSDLFSNHRAEVFVFPTIHIGLVFFLSHFQTHQQLTIVESIRLEFSER